MRASTQISFFLSKSNKHTPRKQKHLNEREVRDQFLKQKGRFLETLHSEHSSQNDSEKEIQEAAETEMRSMTPVLQTPQQNNAKNQKKSGVKNLKKFPDGIKDQIMVSHISIRESQESNTIENTVDK